MYLYTTPNQGGSWPMLTLWKACLSLRCVRLPWFGLRFNTECLLMAGRLWLWTQRFLGWIALQARPQTTKQEHYHYGGYGSVDGIPCGSFTGTWCQRICYSFVYFYISYYVNQGYVYLCRIRLIYSRSTVFCYGFIVVNFTHILQGYLTDTRAILLILRLLWYQLSNPDGYG